jgi:IS5 family transposase
MEQLDYNFLFRWFVGLSIDDPVWDVTVFTNNRERLLAGEVADGFFTAVLAQARAQGLLWDEHFTVDGTLIEAWAGHKSFKRKDADQQTPPDDSGNPSVDFHGERRTNATHQSTTDPEARLARKGAGKEAKLSYAGHVLMENRNGIAVNGRVTQATGRAEPQAAMALVEKIAGWHRVTLGADKGYARRDFVQELRDHRVTPHIARKPSTIIDERTTRHPGYAVSQHKRKRVEEIFGLAQDRRGPAQDSASRTRSSRLDVHVRTDGLQPSQDAQPAARTGINQPARYPRCSPATQPHPSSTASARSARSRLDLQSQISVGSLLRFRLFPAAC